MFHPYRALPALVEGARLKAKATGIPPQPERIMALHDGARAALDDILVSGKRQEAERGGRMRQRIRIKTGRKLGWSGLDLSRAVWLML